MTAARARLTRDRVLTAAVALADRDGPDALTLRGLAEDLGVHPTSLYNHLPNKDAILDGVVERLIAGMDLPPSDDWRDWIRGLAAGMRGMAQAHPGAFLVFTRRPAHTRRAYDLTEQGLEAFLRAGFPLARAVVVMHVVSVALLGLALDESQLPTDVAADGLPADPGSAFAQHPHLQEVVRLGLDDHAGSWELLVEALIAGLRPTG
jgi:AcrR family transcriptional regulator